MKAREIMAAISRSQPLVSQHLRKLIEAGHVTSNSDGTYEATGK